jgi:hypothetical protein
LRHDQDQRKTSAGDHPSIDGQHPRDGPSLAHPRQVIRNWLRRYAAQGRPGLEDHSRSPHSSPRHTPAHVKQQALEAWRKTPYGRRRLALYLRAQGLSLSPHTIGHIFRRRRVHRTPAGSPHRRRPSANLFCDGGPSRQIGNAILTSLSKPPAGSLWPCLPGWRRRSRQ